MSRNSLFQSATGLGTPSTSRKKDFAVATPTAQADERNDHFVVRNGVKCAGAHLIIDLYDAQKLDDIDHIEAALRCLRGGVRRDAAAHPSASLRAEWRRVRRRRAGGKPHLDPFMARERLCRARCVHVRRCQAGSLRAGAARGVQAGPHRGERDPARAGRLASSVIRARSSCAGLTRHPFGNNRFALNRWMPGQSRRSLRRLLLPA